MNKWQLASQSLISIQDYIRFAFTEFSKADLFYGHGTDNPWDEAVALVLQSLELPHDLPNHWLSSRLTQAEKEMLSTRIEQRVEQKLPLSYITHKAYFAGIEFYSDERALVPRSPIAELIENGFSPWLDVDNIHSILDLCTGSGCIAIACGLHFPHAQVLGTDISQDALALAESNKIKTNAVNVNFLMSDGFKQIPEQKFDLIVSNPPYVDAEDFAAIPDEFKAEPELGLVSGDDGLDFTRHLLACADNYLSDNGILIVEVGNSALALEKAFPEIAFTWLEFERGGDGIFLLDKSQLKAITAKA